MRRLHGILIALVAAGIAYELCAGSTVHANGSPPGSVSPASPMLEPRSGHTATLLQDGKVLIARGMRRNQDFYSSAELYDPATGKFRVLPKTIGKRGRPTATLLGSGDVLITGGADDDTPGGVASAELFRADFSKLSVRCTLRASCRLRRCSTTVAS